MDRSQEPNEPESFSARLRKKYGEGVDPEVSIGAGDAQPASGATSELLKRLSEHGLKSPRYKLEGEVARGGMGAILRVWDEDLRRHLAMKVVLGRGDAPGSGGTPQVDAKVLARFLEEAQVTGQLDHPGIVPVHELGLDADGRVYFTMKLVKGRDLKAIFDLVFQEKEGWNETRALGVILKACEAMAYAHKKGVIHRDLKPANIMVGGFGEVFVMDWGLARVLIEQLSARSDVYSVGAMLYHLLARQMPYVPPGARVSNRTILGMVLQGAPTPLHEISKGVPAELVAICEKAMAREADLRYADTLVLAEDLRAYIEHRVVGAYETGAVAELKKWVARNKPLAATMAAGILILVAGIFVSTAKTREAEAARRDTATTNAQLESTNLSLAVAKHGAEQNEENAKQQSYVANIIAADASLRANEVAEAKRRLNACEESRRGWEWRYLHLATDTSLMVLRGHDDSVASAVFSRDGSRIASASWDKTVRVWNASTGETVLVLRGHDDHVRSVAFSPDGLRIASTSDDKTVRVWNATSGECLLVLRGHDFSVSSVTFSPDGSRLASPSWDRTIRVWDATNGQCLLVLRGHDQSVTSVAFSPDGSRIASASGDKTVRVWDATSGEVLLVLRGHDDLVHSVAFSPDGLRMASSSDTTVHIWDAITGQQLLVFRGHSDQVHSVAFSPDGSCIASASSDKTVRVWSATSGESLSVLHGHDNKVNSVAFAPDGLRVVSASSDGTIRVWNAVCGDGLLVLHGHKYGVEASAFSPDGNRIASASSDSTLRLWDAHSGENLFTLRRPAAIGTVTFSPDGSRIASGSTGSAVDVCDADSGQRLLVLNGHNSQVSSVAFSSDCSRIASASLDKTIRVWDATTGANLLVLRGHDDGVQCVAFSPDDSRIASAGWDTTVCVWDATSGETLLVLHGHDDLVQSIAFSPDGLRIASASRDKTVRLWDATNGACLLVLRGHDDAVTSVAFSPDGSRIASASWDKTVRVWDATSGESLLVLRGHGGKVSSVAFSPDGARLASASDDTLVRIWDTDTAALHDSSRTTAETARLFVQSLFDRFTLVEDVVEYLRSDVPVRDDVHSIAIHLAQLRDNDPSELNTASWLVVKNQRSDASACQHALRLAHIACDLHPEYGIYLNTLGVAQYRLGQYEAALVTLTHSDELDRGEQPTDAAFLAMTNHQLGRAEAAQAALTRLRELMRNPQWTSDVDARISGAEAELVITSPPTAHHDGK